MFKQNLKHSTPCYFFVSVSLAMNHDNREYKFYLINEISPQK